MPIFGCEYFEKTTFNNTVGAKVQKCKSAEVLFLWLFIIVIIINDIAIIIDI